MERMEEYSRLVEQEERHYRKLETFEQCQCAIFDYIHRFGGQLDEMTSEQVLTSIYLLENGIRRELLHTRLSKAFLAYAMKTNPTE